MKISKDGEALLTKYKKLQKLDVLMLLLVAAFFVFYGAWYISIPLAALTFMAETKLYKCPHCGKSIDPRHRINEETCCPKCEKYLFKI